MKKTTVTSFIIFLSSFLTTFSQGTGSSCFVYYNVRVIACDVYLSPGSLSITSSGFYLDTIPSRTACDTVLFLTTTINANKDTVVRVARCDSFLTPNGKILDSTGIYFDTIPTALGCDSAITYVFTKGKHTKPTEVVTACDSFTSLTGKTWKTSGVYFDTLVTPSSCDTILSYQLTILNSQYDTSVIHKCFFHGLLSGRVVTTSGTYVDTLSASNGCNRYATQIVTIGTAYTVIPLRVYCDSLITRTGKIIKTSGVHRDTVIYPTGCDSIYEYNVQIGPTYDTISTNVCDTFTTPSGILLTATGLYSDTIAGASCDSIVYYIDLTVNPNYRDTSVVFACDTFYSPISQKSWNLSGLYFDTTLTTTTGCDSLIYYDIEIGKQQTSSSIAQCWSYTLPSGSSVITTSGIYLDTLPTTAGCDSILILTIEINRADTAIIERPGELIAFEAGANYQWLDCNAGFAPVAGATNQSFLPATLGTYSVEVTKRGCVDTSGCYVIDSYASLVEKTELGLSVYPNPTQNQLNIELENKESGVSFQVYSISGELLIDQTSSTVSTEIIDVSKLTSGIYLLRVTSGSLTKSVKIMKE